MEIVKSDLEEKAVVNKDGTLSNFYQSPAKAGVSPEAFMEFESMIAEVNKEVKEGNLVVGQGMLDIKPTNSKSEVSPRYIGETYCFTHDQVEHAKKIIGLGGGLAAVAAALGVTPAIAAVFAMLYATADLCDWNGRGFCIIEGPTGWFCVPL